LFYGRETVGYQVGTDVSVYHTARTLGCGDIRLHVYVGINLPDFILFI